VCNGVMVDNLSLDVSVEMEGRTNSCLLTGYFNRSTETQQQLSILTLRFIALFIWDVQLLCMRSKDRSLQ